MNIAKAYTNGFLKAVKLPRMLLILYFVNLFTGLLLALSFMGVLKDSFDNSMIVSNLLNNFDFTAFSNLMYYNGDSIFAILGGIKWLFLAYFILSVFLTGGIIGTYNKDYFTNSNFFGSAAYNFFRFLGLNILILLVQAIFFLLIYIPLILVLQSTAPKVESELTLYYIAIAAFMFHALLFMLIANIGDYGKFYMVIEDSFNVFKGFSKGFNYVFSHFIKTFMLYLMLLFLPAVIMYIYLYVERDIKMATGIGILMVFLMQQAFIFLRCFLRAWILASQYSMYASDIDPSNMQVLQMKKVKEVKPKKEIKPKLTEKKSKEKEKEKTPVIEEVPKIEQSNYAIDFNSTFSTQNKNIQENQSITEEEKLKIFADDSTENKIDTKTENTHKISIPKDYSDDESIQNQEEEKLEEYINNQTDKDIEAKMFESLVNDISFTEANPLNTTTEKSYLAGETVEFTDEEQIEQKMIHEMGGEVGSGFDTNSKQFVNENITSGTQSFSDDIDNEADNDETLEYDDFEDDPEQFQNQYERVEQNVVEKELPEDQENSSKKRKEKQEGEDNIEFEL